MNKEGMYRLIAAIIQQALHDYRIEKLKYERICRRRGIGSRQAVNQKYTVDALEGWFHSEWYQTICNIDGDYLLSRYEEVREKGWFKEWQK